MGGITILGNFSVDRVNDEPPSPGGCPTFAALALEACGGDGRIITRLASRDRPVFSTVIDHAPVPLTVLSAQTTSAFGLRYVEEERVLTVDAVGDPWTSSEIEAAAIDTAWVHIAPLLRSDFPWETLALLASTGHRVSYDGQGLVRVPRLGRLRLDTEYERALLGSLSVLKLNDEEARVIAPRTFDVAAAERLGVPEIVVTFGSAGCDLYVEGCATHVPAARTVQGVQNTGAGDAFMVAYLADRARAVEPVEAARRASELVARMLEARLRGSEWPSVVGMEE